MIEELRERTQRGSCWAAAPDRLEKQHKGGKLTARERVDALVDPGSFEEIGLFAQHRATLFGMAGKELPGRRRGHRRGVASTAAWSTWPARTSRSSGGSAGEVHSIKVAEIMEQSLKTGIPFVFINDSGGARVQEGIDSLSGYGKVFYTNVMLSGRGAADLADLRPVRGRRGLQPGADRLHHPDPPGADVHHRAAGHQAGDRRERDRRSSWAGPTRTWPIRA